MNGLGYLISIISVLFLGLAAWPSVTDDSTKAALILAGGAASIVGMVLRYFSHRKDKRKIEKARAGR